jgi:hypothetical protein
MTISSGVIGVSRIVVEGKSRSFSRQNLISRQLLKLSPCIAVISLAFVLLPGITGSNGALEAKVSTTNILQSGTVATVTTLVSSLNPSYSSQSLTLTATVTSQSSGTPTGTLTFFDGGTQLSQAALNANGQGQVSASGLSVGSHSITAQYSGDANFAASVGTVAQIVNAPPTPVSISVTPNNPVLFTGDTQQFAATGQYGDGSSLDLTNMAAWNSSDTTVATFNASGLASAVGGGNTNTTATYNGMASSTVNLGVKARGGNVMFLGGGSSAMFLELGQAAQSSSTTGTPCVWTYSASSSASTGQALSRDNRPVGFPPNLPTDDFGDIWITWSPGTGSCAAPAGNFDIYSYTSLDSVIGVRCYFEVDSSDNNSGCIHSLTVPPGTTGENKLCNTTGPCVFGPDTPIPQAVISSVHTKHWFAVGTDILPEDAKYAILRLLTPCGQAMWRQAFDQQLRQDFGLGYQGAVAGIGIPVLSHFSNAAFHSLDFNFAGNDPINVLQPVRGYSITTLGAKPILVVVSPAGGTSLGAATDIPTYMLASFTDGTLGRSTDLIGPTVTSPVTTLINEPLSGPYYVMEYSVTNSSQFHTSQDIYNCNSNGGVYSNGMDLQSALGKVPASRVRALGTGEMISQLQSSTPSDQRLGYFYWSAANAASFTATNGKYLTVNGVDPIQDVYTDGVFPGVDAAHPLSNVTFKWLNMGDYPIWSVLRIISKYPTPIGVSTLISAAQTLNASQHNFVSPSNLNVWHSHYYLPIVGSNTAANGTTLNTAGDLCSTLGALAEFGGDAGGSNILKQAHFDFCQDFANVTGLINKTN